MDNQKTACLYLVGTPIGNMGDLSPRAREILATADFIAAEDTRVSGKLLAAIGVKKPMISYFEHNKTARGELILSHLQAGETVALVTDAGMPAISDPGEDLVALCIANGITVRTAPGPTAVISALAMSGLSTQRFCFEGFLSMNKNARREHLTSLTEEKRTMIFYEAPHKLIATLHDMYATFGDRRITLCREITKLYEENIHTTLAAAQALYSDDNPPRGEYVLVIEGAPAATEEEANTALEAAVELAKAKIDEGMSLKDAARFAADKSGIKRNAIYSKLLEK